MIRLIAQHKTNINNFLTYAGYKYRVDIAGEESRENSGYDT